MRSKTPRKATNSRIMEAEDRISEVEDRMVEINESERKKEKWIKRNEDNLRDLQDDIKCPNIQIIGVPEEENKKKDHEKILEEIIVENFPKMGKEIITQVQETQRIPNRINPRWNTPRHLLIKLTKVKHRELMLLNRGVGEDSWESLRLQGDQTRQKEISPEYSLEGLMLKLKLQYFGHLMQRTDSLEKTLMLGKVESRRRGRQWMRWMDGITD